MPAPYLHHFSFLLEAHNASSAWYVAWTVAVMGHSDNCSLWLKRKSVTVILDPSTSDLTVHKASASSSSEEGSFTQDCPKGCPLTQAATRKLILWLAQAATGFSCLKGLRWDPGDTLFQFLVESSRRSSVANQRVGTAITAVEIPRKYPCALYPPGDLEPSVFKQDYNCLPWPWASQFKCRTVAAADIIHPF